MFKELGIPGLKPERLEVVSAIFKGDVFAIAIFKFGNGFWGQRSPGRACSKNLKNL